MATAGSIVVDLLMRTGSFETDSKRAERNIKQLEREINKTVKRLTMFGAAAGGAFTAAIASANSYMAEIGMAAERTSVSAKSFSELAYAADDASLSQGELERVLRRSTEAINHAEKGGSKQAEALRKLGISAYDASGQLKTADVMLRDMADKFSKLEPGARKTGLVIDLFGQQLGQKVIPLLNGGADGLDEMAEKAKSLGLVIDDEAAQAAIDFETNLSELKNAGKGLAVTFAQDLIPWVNKLASEFALGMKYSNGFFDALMKYGMTNPFLTTGEQLERVNKEIKETEKALKSLENADVKGYVSNLLSSGRLDAGMKPDDYRKKLSDLKMQQGYFIEMMKREFEEGFVGPHFLPPSQFSTVTTFGDDDGGKPPLRGRSTQRIDEGERYIKQMNERIALLGKETEYEQLLAKTSLGSITFRNDELKESAFRLAKNLDIRAAEIEQEGILKDLREQHLVTERQFMREIEAFGQGAWLSGLNGELARIEDKYQRIIEDRRNSPMGLSDSQLAAIQDSLNIELEMVRTHHENLRAIKEDWALGASEALVNYADDAANLYQSLGDSVSSAFQGMEDSLVQFAKTGKLNFSGLADSIISDMIRMATQQAILGPLAGALGGWMGGFGNAVDVSYAPVHGFSDGGFTGIGGKYEPAGVVHKGEYVITKEATSRIGVPALDRLNKGYSSGGYVGNLPSRGPSQDSPKVQVNITVNNDGQAQTDTQGSAEGWRQFADEIRRFVEAQIREREIRSHRSGGLAWQARKGY